ncbi:hypothetical protein L218DRAFT_886521, partial [Marasmius fiardii PR-910]
WKGGDQLQFALKAVGHMVPPTSVRDKRKPVTLEMLKTLVGEVDLSNALDAAVAAALVTGFYGQAQLGEILSTSPDYSRYDRLVLPVISDLSISDDKPSYRLFLPSTKTSLYHGDTITLPSQMDETDPMDLIINHIQVDNPTATSLLFSYLVSKGAGNYQRCLLTKNIFMERCNGIWEEAGFGKFTGHSLRIGGTTHYLACGVHPNIIKATGRWTSDAFQKYWRYIDRLADILERREPLASCARLRHDQSICASPVSKEGADGCRKNPRLSLSNITQTSFFLLLLSFRQAHVLG